jgi:Protein of unknown function (DUF551)
MTEWRTIDSAPRDGTRVLIYKRGFAEDIFVAWYSTTWEGWHAAYAINFVEPTHWMPLPEPPAYP